MNDNMQYPQLPFLTREMLKFGNKSPMKLKLNAAADSAGRVSLRGITRSGMISLDCQTSQDGRLNTTEIGIDDFPILLSVIDPSKFFTPQKCWVSVELEIFDDEIITLCSGFIYLSKGVSYPAMEQESVTPGRGFMKEEISNNPAPGAECSITVPAGEMWLIHSASVEFITDATILNRKPHFVFKNPLGTEVHSFGYSNTPANTTILVSAAKFGYVPDSEDAGITQIVLPPDLWLLPGATITTETSCIQAGDDLGIMKVLVEKFFGMTKV